MFLILISKFVFTFLFLLVYMTFYRISIEQGQVCLNFKPYLDAKGCYDVAVARHTSPRTLKKHGWEHSTDQVWNISKKRPPQEGFSQNVPLSTHTNVSLFVVEKRSKEVSRNPLQWHFGRRGFNEGHRSRLNRNGGRRVRFHHCLYGRIPTLGSWERPTFSDFMSLGTHGMRTSFFHQAT